MEWSPEKKLRKAHIKMGERHHRYIWYDGNSTQTGGGQASILREHFGSDVLKRICFQMKK